MAYTDNFPQRPVFMADFANGGKIDPRATFTRSDTPPTYAAPSAVHYWSNEKHLSSENRVTNSNDLSDWGLVDITRTLGQVGPDGASTAAKLTGQAGTVFKAILNATLANTSAQTISFFAKEDTHRYIQVSVNGDATKFVNFDLNGSGAYSANGSGVTASITASANGYLRCAVNLTLPNTAAYISLQDSLSAAREATTASTGSIYIFGAMATTLGDATNVAAYVSTGSQIHREYAPTLKSVATAGQPRFEYDPATDGQSMGCLIESQATNLVTYSEDSTQWTSGASAVTAAAGVAPDGTLSASLWVPNSTSGVSHYVYATKPTISNSTTYTASVFVKPAGINMTQLTFNDNKFATGYVNFDLSGSGAVSASSNATGTIKPSGGGYYRLTITATSNAASSIHSEAQLRHITSLSDTRGPLNAGDDYRGLLVWGWSYEASSFASSYLKSNSGSTTTRALESLSMTDSSLFDNGEGTIVAEFALPSGPTADQATTVTGAVVGITASTSNNYVRLQTDTRSNVYSASMYADGSSQLTISSAGDTGGQFVKKALSFTQNDTTLCRNGTLSTTDTNCVTPSGLQTIQFGAVSPSYTGATASGHYKRVAIYNEALSDTNLQALTS